MQTSHRQRNQDSSLVEAICESDPSQWVFIPSDPQESALCSRSFVRQWNLPHIETGTQTPIALKSLATALDAMGIPAAQFISDISATDTEIPDNISVVGIGGVRANVTVHCVFDRPSGVIVGHLARFRMLSDTTVLDSVLDQIAVARKKLGVLSKRELEILYMVYEGRTNKAISIAASISEKTVEKHRSRIVQKLGLSCTAMLVRLITVARLLPSEIEQGDDENPEGQFADVTQKSAAGFRFQPPIH